MKEELEKLMGDIDASLDHYVEDDKGIEFDICCIGHAATLKAILKATDVDWGYLDCHFMFHKLPEPKPVQSITQLSSDPQQCYVSFDSSVATYAKSVHPFDVTARLAVIKAVEEHVTKLVFNNQPQPKDIKFTWTSGNMALMEWRQW